MVGDNYAYQPAGTPRRASRNTTEPVSRWTAPPPAAVFRERRSGYNADLAPKGETMLQITEQAASALQTIRAEQDDRAIVRISQSASSASDGGSPQLRLELVLEPQPDDQIVAAPDGAEVCIAAPVAAFLDSKVLDSTPDARGWPTFVFRAA
jgi:Fe-S cluster assembly iron-binding protein IscA